MDDGQSKQRPAEPRIVTRPATRAYRENFERVFGRQCPICRAHIRPGELGDEQALAQHITETHQEPPEEGQPMKKTERNPCIVVRELGSGKEVHRVELKPPFSDRHVERVLSGLLRNMGTDRYYADDSECDEWLKKHEASR